MTQTLEFNQTKSDAFADKMIGLLNNAALSFMVSVGHRTGLFDKLKNLKPMTSEQIAKKTNLNERYVREWLGAMTVGGLLEHDSINNTYHLPAEHGAFLSREDAANNIATFAQYFSVMGSVENDIVNCFKNGGGVPYSKFQRFHEVMAEDSGQSVLPALFDHILPLVAGLIEQLDKGIDVLDMGCGRGRALVLMAEKFPNSKFTGWDLSQEAIDWATTQAKQKNLKNIKFEVKNLTQFPKEHKFDLITSFDAVHDQARPDLVLAGISGALKNDGVYLMQDIAGSSHVHKNTDLPLGPLLYSLSTFHCMTVSLAEDGMGLGTMWGEETALKMLKQAGFDSVEVKKLSHDIQNQYYIARK